MDSLRPKRRTVSTPSSVLSAPKRRRATELLALPYERLDPEKREIRLLEIAPGKPGSRITGQLFVVSLNDNPSYEAISYMWGPPHPSYDICINGHKRFPGGRNLRKALDDVRLLDRPRVLWTDAICINQLDNGERAHQIQLMQKVYCQAQAISACIDFKPHIQDPAFQDLNIPWQIYSATYWQRLWVQQELILARDIKIYCGGIEFDGQGLLEFQRMANDTRLKLYRPDSPVAKISKYINKRETSQGILNHRASSGGILQARKNISRGRLFHEKHQQETQTLRMTAEVQGTR